MNVGSNYSAVIQALGSGTADIAETGPFAAALGVKTDNVDVILQRKGFGSWTYVSQIAIPKDSDVTSLSDLSGKTVAFSDRLSTSGALYPLYNLSQAGVDIGQLPEGNGSQASIEPVFAGGHVKSYTLLKKGRVDAAGMGGFVPGIVDNFEANAKVLDKQEGLPRAPIVVSPEIPDESRDALTKAFLDAPDEIYLGADGEEDTDENKPDDDLWFSAVREASVDDYQSVIDVANELGVGQEIFES
jgi:phosphonate transport system substrate-binding protein